MSADSYSACLKIPRSEKAAVLLKRLSDNQKLTPEICNLIKHYDINTNNYEI